MTIPEPYWTDGQVSLYLGDCLDLLPSLPEASVDSIVTDPPYGLEFMGKEWDGADGFRRSLNPADGGRDNVFGRTSRTGPEYRTAGTGQRGRPGIGARPTDWVSNQGWNGFRCRNCGHLAHGGSPCACETPDFVRADNRWPLFQEWCQAWATECLRILKPGGHMLAFGGTRTWHRLTCAIEDAGFEIRDTVADLTGISGPGLLWVYSQGFAKNLDAGRAVDMHVCTLPGRHRMRGLPENPRPDDHVCPQSPEGDQWRGWGTAAKPAWEPVVVARKPLARTLAVNLLGYGLGALNVDGCRVASGPSAGGATSGATAFGQGSGWNAHNNRPTEIDRSMVSGRWPPNLVLAHSPQCVQVGEREIPGDCRAGQEPGTRPGGFGDIGADSGDARPNGTLHGPQVVPVFRCAPGCPVAEMDRQSSVLTSGANPVRRGSDKFRDAYGEFAGQPECVPARSADSGGASRFFPVFRYNAKASQAERPRLKDGTAWPTVKPVDLIRWIARLVTPPGGLILDPFAGTGPLAEACIIEGFRCILLDKDPVAVALIQERLSKDIQPDLFGGSEAS